MGSLLSFVSSLDIDWTHLVTGTAGAAIVTFLWTWFGYYYNTRLNAIDVLLKLEDCYEQCDNEGKSVRSILESLENDDVYRHYAEPLKNWVASESPSSQAQEKGDGSQNNTVSKPSATSTASTPFSNEDKKRLGEIDRIMRFWFKCRCIRRRDIDYGALNTLHQHYLRRFVLDKHGDRKELSEYAMQFWPTVYDWARIVDSRYKPGLGDTTDGIWVRLRHLLSSGKGR